MTPSRGVIVDTILGIQEIRKDWKAGTIYNKIELVEIVFFSSIPIFMCILLFIGFTIDIFYPEIGRMEEK